MAFYEDVQQFMAIVQPLFWKKKVFAEQFGCNFPVFSIEGVVEIDLIHQSKCVRHG